MNEIVYSGGTLDRAATSRRDAEWLAQRLADPSSRVVPVWRAQNLVNRSGDKVQAVRLRVDQTPWLGAFKPKVFFLGNRDGVGHFAVDLSAADDPSTLLPQAAEFVDLRSVGALLSREDGALLAFARGLCHWHQGHGFCGHCGAPTVSGDGGYTRRCTAPDCRTEHYPRTDPAVIVLVSAGDHCLLARQAKWLPGMFSTLAGFVEPGETLEEAVIREVKEEAGVVVSRMRYHSSQPWPFPSSLMVGFMAEADHVSELKVDHHELEQAGWFTRADITAFPKLGRSLPRKDSIARRLVEQWLGAKNDQPY